MNTKSLPKIALGAWAWGNDGTFGHQLTKEDLQPVFDTAMDNGLYLWDTAFAYGMGTSEKLLGEFMKERPRYSYLVSDKLTPQCMNPKSETPVKDMLDTELEFLGIDRMDIYWVHNPVDSPKWIAALAEYFEGKKDVPIETLGRHSASSRRFLFDKTKINQVKNCEKY